MTMAVLKVLLTLAALSVSSNADDQQPSSPLLNCAKIVNYTGDEVTLQNISKVLLTLHNVGKRSIQHSHTAENMVSPLEHTEDLLRMAALLPAETLQLLRTVTVPLINNTLGIPAALLERAANVSYADFHPANWTIATQTNSWLDVSQYAPFGHNFSNVQVFNMTNSTSLVQNNIVTPMANLLEIGANTTRKAFDPAHMRRTFDHLKRFLGARGNASQQNESSTTVPGDDQQKSTTAQPPAVNAVVLNEDMTPVLNLHGNPAAATKPAS